MGKFWDTVKKGSSRSQLSPEEIERNQQRWLEDGKANLAVNSGRDDAGNETEQSPQRKKRASKSAGKRQSSRTQHGSLQSETQESSEARNTVRIVTPPPIEGSSKDTKLAKSNKQQQSRKDTAIPTKSPRRKFFSIMERPRGKMGDEDVETNISSGLVSGVGPAGVDVNKDLPQNPASEDSDNDDESSSSSQTIDSIEADTTNAPNETPSVGPFNKATDQRAISKLPDVGVVSSASNPQQEVPLIVPVQERDAKRAVLRKPIIQDVSSGLAENETLSEKKIVQNLGPVDLDPLTTGTHTMSNEDSVGSKVEEDFNKGLDRIYRYLYQVKIEHPDIPFQKISKPCSLNQIEEAMQSLLQAYSTISLDSFGLKDTIKNQQTEIDSFKISCNDSTQMVQELRKKAEETASETKISLAVLERTISNLEKREEKFEEKLENQRTKLRLEHESRVETLSKDQKLRVEHLNNEFNNLKLEQENSIKIIKQKHESQMLASTTQNSKLLTEMEHRLGGDLFREQESHSHTKRDFEKLKKEYGRELSKLSAQNESDNRMWGQALEERRKEMEIKLTTKKFEYDEASKAAGEVYQLSFAKLQAQHAEAIDAKTREISDLKNIQAGRIYSMNEEFKRELAQMNAKLDQALKDKGRELRSMAAAHEQALQLSDQKFQEHLDLVNLQLKQARDGKAQEILHIKNKQESDIRIADQAYQKEMNSLTAQRDRLLLEKDTELKKQKAYYEETIFKLKEAHKIDKAAHTRALQLTIEALKKALVERDHFSAMSDDEVVRRFHDIGSEIDQLSRVPWEASKERSWPFLPSSFPASESRRAKKNIIGNSMWVVLHDNIFCTPFRMLGKRGRLLEQEWVRRFGQNQKYRSILSPRATKESETWRYETMMKFVEATRQPLTESNSEIKNAFETTLSESTEQLVRELECVASVSQSDKQRVNELVKAMAELWLEVGQQRCRMFFLMSESDKVPVKSRQKALGRDRTLELVVVPQLRRLGNAQGDRLDTDEVVMDCKGEFSVFRPS